VFDSVDTIRTGLAAIGGLIGTLQFRTDAMAASADSPYAAATDLAEFLVRGGTPFRDAHAIVGALVRRSLDHGDDLAQLVSAEPRLGPDAVGLLAPGVSVTHRTTPGGAGPQPVAVQRDQLAHRIDEDRARLGALATR
jgi:argininosuccinate lyase